MMIGAWARISRSPRARVDTGGVRRLVYNPITAAAAASPPGAKLVRTIETDYLIVGAGAVGMAFADTLLSETDADIVLVDRNGKPGGHWNSAYSFVTLHQPPAFYGVASTELSKGRLDASGLNAGLGELASGAEVLAYFDEVMRHRFLPSGRVRFFPMSDEVGDCAFVSRVSGARVDVKVRRKVVDATWLNTSVPSTHTPSFSIAPGVMFMPLNDLTRLKAPPRRFVVIGGGKTGIDACLWLLENGVDPDAISWIMPRDGWLLDRRNTQPGIEFFHHTMEAQARQIESAAAAASVEDLFDRLERAGVLRRIDPAVRPKMFHGATVSEAELNALRRIKDIVRMGRVSAIERDRVVLAAGEIETGPDVAHIDCSASAIANLATTPIFAGARITPQTVRSYQPVFSAAFIAHVEAAYGDDEAKKNELCRIVPLPNHDTDWIHGLIAQMMNQYAWSQDKDLGRWVANCRLDGFGKMVRSIDKDDAAKQDVMRRIRDNAFAAVANLQRLAADIA